MIVSGLDRTVGRRSTMPALGRGMIRLLMACGCAALALTIGLFVQPAVASAKQSVFATSVPHSTDPDCTSYTSPQNGAFVEACATPAGATFGYENEPPSEFEAVQFTNELTNQVYQWGVQMPASGTQCALNSAGSFTPTQTSCTFSVPLSLGCYSGFATLTYNDQTPVRMQFRLVCQLTRPAVPWAANVPRFVLYWDS